MIKELTEIPPRLFGNDITQENSFLQCCSGGTESSQHHALLLFGPKGVGKASFSLQLAMIILGAARLGDDNTIKNNPDSAAFQQMRQQSHPDFYYLHPSRFDNKSGIIPTLAREKLMAFLSRTGDSPRRVVIIDSMDDCAPALMQSLLKPIEEPPAKTLFLLIAHQKNKVLPTILSRTLHFPFHTLNDNDMRLATKNMLTDSDETQAAYCRFLAHGTPGTVLQIRDADFAAIENSFATMLDDTDANSNALHNFAKLISDPKHQHLLPFRLWINSLARHSVRATWTIPTPVPEGFLKLIRRVATALHHPDTQQQFRDSLALLEKIQQPPAYLDPEATMVHIAYQWQQMFHTT